ncbi:MAG: DUF1574 domain-containing protein [Saprospiraceae bacterium]|nr:DUF1574 domain-containing protein [Saprospiraceae bacterium]
MKELRQFQMSLVKVSLLGLLALLPILLFHVCIDPYGVFLRLYDHSPTEPNKRYIKIKHILDHPDAFDSFIFGNSRVNAFHTDQFPEGRFYNMSYTIGVPANHLEEIRYLLEKGIKIKHIVIALDHTGLIENHEVKKDDLLRKRYPVGLFEKIKFYSSYLYSIPSREYVKTILAGSLINWAELDATGYIESKDKEHKTNPLRHVVSTKFQEKIVHLHSEPEMRKNIEVIRELVRLAEQQGFQLTFFLNPLYHTAFTTTHLPAYYTALRELAAITPYVDFSGIHKETLDKCNYHESSHYSSELAEQMTQILFSKSQRHYYTFGTYVDQSNVENHIQAHLSFLSTYFQSKNLIDTTKAYSTNPEHRLLSNTYASDVHFKTREPLLISSPLFPLTVQASGQFDPAQYRIRIHGKNIPFCRIENIDERLADQVIKHVCWVESKHLGEGTHNILLVHQQKNRSSILDSLVVQVAGVEGTLIDWKECLSPDTTNSGSVDQVTYVTFPEKMAAGAIKKIVHLDGWLATSKTKQPADELFVQYENQLYPVHLRTHRADVNQFLGASPELHFGFYVTIPVHSEDVQQHTFDFFLFKKESNTCEIFRTR